MSHLGKLNLYHTYPSLKWTYISCSLFFCAICKTDKMLSPIMISELNVSPGCHPWFLKQKRVCGIELL